MMLCMVLSWCKRLNQLRQELTSKNKKSVPSVGEHKQYELLKTWSKTNFFQNFHTDTEYLKHIYDVVCYFSK